jgi:hypothetical protein
MFRRLMLASTLALALAACNGGGGDLAGPDDPGPAPHNPNPDPGPQDPGPQPQDPPPPPPPQNAGITGTYMLTQINSSTPGQLVTIANPDGIVIGLYRFDASTTIVLDPLQTFDLQIHYTDDKSQFTIADAGEFKGGGESQGFLVVTFNSAVYGDSFTGTAGEGLLAIQYDMDGDGNMDTVFGFQRVG